MITAPQAALAALKEGNARYLQSRQPGGDISPQVRTETARQGQRPYAIVITCSDSRVPAEYIFSAGIGQLFIIRTAGNVIGDFELGSIEYGAEHLGAPLIVVMGHTHCGAVAAALEGHAEGSIRHIVNEIRPALAGVTDPAEGERRNIRNSVDRVMTSPIIQQLMTEGKLDVKEALYDIESGQVSFW